MAGVWIRRAPVREPRDASIVEVKYECPVCYEVHLDNDFNHTTTACGHKTCRGCFKEIVKTSMACPICRHPLLYEKAQMSFPDSKLLGLFILNPNFFAVPGSTVLLRVFEPRYLILVKRCIENDMVFGLQAGFRARRGVLISIRRHRELPEGHIIMEGIVVARYEAFDGTSEPQEEPDTFGLYRMKSKLVGDTELREDETAEAFELSKRCETLLKARFDDMSRYEKEVIGKVCGACPSSLAFEFSFWLLGALYSPTSKADVLYSRSVTERLRFCAALLEQDQPFECLMEEAQASS